jgi:hypothetical protein
VATGPEQAAASAPPPAVDPAADQRLAQSLVLDANEMPFQWERVPHQADPAEAQVEREDAACLGLADPAATKSAEAYGVDASSHAANMATTATVTRTEQQARDFVTAWAGPKSAACVERSLRSVFTGDGMTVDDVGIGRFAASTGDVRSVAMHAEVAVSKEGQGAVIYVDVVFMQQRRVVGQAVFASLNTPFASDVEQTIITRFAHKIAGV